MAASVTLDASSRAPSVAAAPGTVNSTKAGMKPPELVRVFKGHTAPVSAAFFHPCMHQLVSGSHDGRLYVWHFKQQLRPFKFEGHKADVNDVSVAKDGSFFASASSDKTVALWLNNAKGTPSHVIKAHTGVVRSCHLSPDNSLLATASDDKIVKIWQVTPTSSKFLMSLEGHTHWVRSVRFSLEDANLVTTCGDDKTVRIWDLRVAGAGAHSAGGGKDRGCVMKMQEHVERVNRSLFHPDGTCIASGSDDRTIKIWDLRRKRLIQHYDAHAGPVLDLDFNSSQNFLASSSTDRTVKLWDLQEGRLLYTLAGHEDAVHSVKFSPQGQHLVSGSADQKVFVWKAGPDEQLYDQPPQAGDGAAGSRVGAARTYLYNAPRSAGTTTPSQPQHNFTKVPSRTSSSTQQGGPGRSSTPNVTGTGGKKVVTQFANEVNSEITHSVSPTKKMREKRKSGVETGAAAQSSGSGSSRKGETPTTATTPIVPSSAAQRAAATPIVAASDVAQTEREKKLMDSIQQMTTQMEMLVQTVKTMDQRMQITEAAVARLEAEKAATGSGTS
ncbi:unnamed protein product [Amoebophrya sp. A120]|nr:unnamed protein product [Amoebophrya sp. A120]|eukprot:GSA120T00010816001.1